jgi:hypothetical protein
MSVLPATLFIQADTIYNELYKWDLATSTWLFIDQKTLQISSLTGSVYTTIDLASNSNSESRNDSQAVAPTGKTSFSMPGNIFSAGLYNPNNPFNSYTAQNLASTNKLELEIKPSYTYKIVERAFKRYGNTSLGDSVMLELKRLDLRPDSIDKEACESKLKELLSPETAEKLIQYLTDIQAEEGLNL